MSTQDQAEIVVGIDGSEPARAALRWAVRQAERTGSRVRAVAVWRQPALVAAPDGGAAAASLISEDDLAAQARHWLDEAIAELGKRDDGEDDDGVTASVEGGDPRSVITELASDAELLVLGNKARGTIAGAIAGSIALHCVHHARCPVVLVPADDPPPGGADR